MVAADPIEFAGLLRRVEEAGPVSFGRQARLGDRRLWMVAGGAGARLAARAAASAPRPDRVLSIGFCGALDPALHAGDVFVATRVMALDENAEFPALPVAAPSASGPLASVDRVVQTAGEKRRLRCCGAKAVEMEAAAVARQALQWGVPFSCVRAVSDEAEESFAIDFNAARRPDGSLSRPAILAAGLRHPCELLRLYRRARLASRALGDFLADHAL